MKYIKHNYVIGTRKHFLIKILKAKSTPEVVAQWNNTRLINSRSKDSVQPPLLTLGMSKWQETALKVKAKF
jgi:hypothetical protein